MKLAIVDHISNAGGGSRFIRNLVHGIRNRYSDVHVDLFGNPVTAEREELLSHLQTLGIRFIPLSSLALSNHVGRHFPLAGKAVRILQESYLSILSKFPLLISGNITQELERKITGYDVAYFAWPYFLEMPNTDCPIVATFHDFNFKYFFGSPIYSDYQIKMLEQQIPTWLQHSTPIVSSNFIRSEIEKFYPSFSSKVNVITLGPLCGSDSIDREFSMRVVSNLGIRQPYILYPTNLCSHKNIGPLIAAVDLLWRSGFSYPLVLTGPGTKSISGRASQIGIEIGLVPNNVIGLGYVSHEEMNCIIMNSSAVVSTSLYEAGNGPGLDAWALGSPVAMSDIPSFTEHIHQQGVRAEVFNPRNPEDIAAKIINIITKPEKTQRNIITSQDSIAQTTWSIVAERYMGVFKSLMEA